MRDAAACGGGGAAAATSAGPRAPAAGGGTRRPTATRVAEDAGAPAAPRHRPPQPDLASPAAEHDQPVRRIVRRHGDRHAIAGNDADVVAAHAPADLGEELHPVVALHAVGPAGERLGDRALALDEIVASQRSLSESRLSSTGW